jgi:peptide/nickel transport system permease protein
MTAAAEKLIAGVPSACSPAAGRGAPPGPEAADPPWPNVHAPDAMRASTSAVEESRPPTLPRALRVFLGNPTAMFGCALLLAACILAGAAQWLYPGDPLDMVARPFIAPGADPAYPLGTDSLGRNVAAGIAHGARISLLVGVSASLIGLALGILVGATAGYFGGWIDDLLGRLIELFQTIPNFILLVVLVAIAQPSVRTIIVAIGLVTWPTVARLTRAEFRVIKHKDFVLAARSLGAGHARIIFREIMPNALPAIIVTGSVMVATAILLESSLSFMGLGDVNVVSWGSMIGAGRDQLRTAWYLTAEPGLAIVLCVLAFNLIGDGLNDALNPRFAEAV